jgi:hypothetical protein
VGLYGIIEIYKIEDAVNLSASTRETDTTPKHKPMGSMLSPPASIF